MNNKNNQQVEFSFYGLSLLSFLKSSHPDKATDTAFIKARADLASQTYSDAIVEGYSHTGASELTNETLYKGLHFSKHDTIVEILWNEFVDEIPQSSAVEFAIRIQHNLEHIFKKYPLSDYFAFSAEYQTLYTELTGEILIWLEDNEL